MALRIPIRPLPRKMKGALGPQLKPEGGPQARIKRLQMLVTALFRHERIEGPYNKCDEARGYAEQLINLAVRNGDKHQETMETANFWLLEKDLVHKLFKVFVPRYHLYETSFTSQYNLPTVYPGRGTDMVILELKGNPYPPVLPQQRDKKKLLHNILIDAAKQEYSAKQKKRGTSRKVSLGDPESLKTDSQDIETEELKHINEKCDKMKEKIEREQEK